MQQARMHHASKIDWYLKKMGVHTTPSPFEQFIAGEINPFDDMQNHNPKGAGQFGSINTQEEITSDKPRLDGDTKITL
jgi:hypothetical protein